jgi:myo-inositol-1(or 4)-monophosphatase
MEYDSLLDCGKRAAAAAAAIHRQHAGRVAVTEWNEKGAADFVSFVDHQAEAAIVSTIRSQFPDHAIMAEEESTASAGSAWSAPERPDPGWTWIVDPLDGTTNFLHGYPMYGVSIAASIDGELKAGVVHNSVTGETWHATAGGGAFRDGVPIRVSEIGILKQALIGTGFPFKALDLLPGYLDQLGLVLRSSAGVRRAGSAALDLCHLASGMFDGFWELSLQPWDLAAGALIVREAGGVITNMNGSSNVVTTGSVLAGNPVIYDALSTLLSGAAVHDGAGVRNDAAAPDTIASDRSAH